MGCFLGCFGTSKEERRRKKRKSKVLPRDQRHASQNSLQHSLSPEQVISEESTDLVPESLDKAEEQLSLSPKKKVTFDTNVKTYEPVAVDGSVESLSEIDQVSEKEEKENSALLNQSNTLTRDDSITSSVGSYPRNHRYQNCRDSDDEGEEYDDEDSDLDDDDDDEIYEEIEDDLIPAVSMESRTETTSARENSEEVDSPITMSGLPERELKGNARDRSHYVHSVLNPVENLTQWKAVKFKGTTPSMPYKENSNADQEVPPIFFSSEPSFKQSSISSKSKHERSKNSNQDVAVDTSLSNWLVSSETTPNQKTSFTGFETVKSQKNISQGTNSPRSFEDRPILGALTLEELKQFSASCSPRKSPSRSPDEMPIIGTVGTYWSHTGSTKDSGSTSSYKGIPNTTSKYREDKQVNWHSTPFETRLERALKSGAAEA